MQSLLTILHILAAIALIALVLVQRGKGSDMGAGFGAGASQTMFGSQGATPFLVKLTGILAFVFFLTCGFLSFYINKYDASIDGNLADPLPIAQQPIKAEPMIPTTTTVPQEQEQQQQPLGDQSSMVLEPLETPLQSLIPQAGELAASVPLAQGGD